MTTTGFLSLDQALDGGFQPGMLYVLGSKPGAMVENFVSSMVFNTLSLASGKIAYFSDSSHMPVGAYENSRPVVRFLPGMPNSPIMEENRSFSVVECPCDDFPAIDTLKGECGRLLFFPKAGEAEKIAENIRLAQKHSSLEMVIVADFDRLRTSGTYDSRQAEVSAMVSLFKSLSLELNLPILLQIAMPRMDTPSGTPTREDFYSIACRAVDEVADTILFLYLSRDEKTPGDAPRSSHVLAIVKNPKGRQCKLSFSHFMCQPDQLIPTGAYTFDHNGIGCVLAGRYSRSQLLAVKAGAIRSMEKALKTLRSGEDAVNLFARMKFGKTGIDPLSGAPCNLMEQINQVFTILMSCYAAEINFPSASYFDFAFAAKSGQDLVAYDSRGNVLAEAEIFTAVSAQNNEKLRKDINRLRDDATISTGAERVVCYTANDKYQLKKYPDDEKVKVMCCSLETFINWIREE